MSEGVRECCMNETVDWMCARVCVCVRDEQITGTAMVVMIIIILWLLLLVLHFSLSGWSAMEPLSLAHQSCTAPIRIPQM